MTDRSRFRLLEGGEGAEGEERFTRVLREVKARSVQRTFLEPEDEGGPLLRRMRRLGRLIEDGELVQADREAEHCMEDVLEFPLRPQAGLKYAMLWVALVALLIVSCFLLLWGGR